MGRRKIFTSVDIKALRDKSRDLSRVNAEREVPSEDIFLRYVPGKEKDFTSSSRSQEKKIIMTNHHIIINVYLFMVMQ